MARTKAALSVLLALFSVLPVLRGSSNINIESIKKAVVFLYKADSAGNASPTGTGFLVSIPLLSQPSQAYWFLVTARHIVDPKWAGCDEPQPEVIGMRVNTKDYDPQKNESGVAFVRIDLFENGTPLWRHHTDDNVDVAAILLDARAFKNFDVGQLLIADFATEEEAKNLRATDPVVSAGLLPAYPGVNRNYPVLKFGNISTQPGELVAAQCVPSKSRLLHLWLLAINLIPGNSGSPIFYVPEGANGAQFGGGRPMLIGLQSMSFGGTDIAGMTPAQYIFETIQAMNLADADLYRGSMVKHPQK
jgi:hypothetical protein